MLEFLAQLFHLFSCPFGIGGAQFIEGQIEGEDFVTEAGSGDGIGFDYGKNGGDGVSDSDGDFLSKRASRELPHPLGGGFVVEWAGRLIAGGAALGKDEEIGAESAAEFDAGVLPIIGADLEKVFIHLGGARNIDHEACWASLCVAGGEEIEAVVFVAFDVAELGRIGVAVHCRSAVDIDPTAVSADHGGGLTEENLAGAAPAPRFADGVGDAAGDEGNDLFGWHGAGNGDARMGGGLDSVGVGNSDFGSGMRMGGMENDVLGIQAGKGGASASDLFLEGGGDGHQITGDEKSVMLAVIQGENGSRDRVENAFGEAGIQLAGEEGGLGWSDIGLGPADEERADGRIHGIPFLFLPYRQVGEKSKSGFGKTVEPSRPRAVY